MNDKKRIVLTGGGTGGHIFPLIAVMEEIRRQCNDAEFLYIGTKSQMGDLAEQSMAAVGIETKNISTGKMRRYFSIEYFFDFFRIPFGIVQSLWHLLIFMPDAVFSKGGYAAIPVVIAARIYRIRVLTHDSDAVPGWANRVGGKLSYYVAVSYVASKRYFLAEKTVLTGNPIRKTMLQGDRNRGYQRWGFGESRPVLFVFGGSQGAQVINEAILRILPELSKLAQVLHVTGKDHYEDVLHRAAEYGFKSGRHQYFATPFLSREEMADAYAVSDIVVSRAGANSITEIAANQKVAILVPLSNSANNHQHMNAFEVARIGGALVLEESNLGSNILTEKITELLYSKELRAKLQENIKVFYHPEAAEKIAAGLLKMIEEK
jgi:UDP-N-acetylglucosamine--N-acetylmuramyl-(pentapeptide) pyrophosphoryl-undecaprenol N-acetylglucosamine transferase